MLTHDKVTFRYIFLTATVLCIMLLSLAPANGQTERSRRILEIWYRDEDLVVTPTRYEKPLSQVAENITVITSEEIEAINAHTLTDVLNIVTGVQIEIRGGPGSDAFAYIQGSDFRHVLVLIDGVSLNNLSDNFADIGAIPVQNIERIEIIKGPASSTWGSSLGGVINIITRAVGKSSKPEGTVSVSYGERHTSDIKADIRGANRDLGYYLSAGNSHSNGFNPNQRAYSNNFYGKLKYDLSDQTNLLWTFNYDRGARGLGQDSVLDFSYNNDYEYVFSTLGLNAAIANNTEMSFSIRMSKRDSEFAFNQLSTQINIDKSVYTDEATGGSAKLSWRPGSTHTFNVGADYDIGELETVTASAGGRRMLDAEKWAAYVNDTLVVSKLSITPGLRYDRTSTNGDFASPSLGATYSLGSRNIIRASVARGFNSPPLNFTYGSGFFFEPNPNLKVEKVWSYQAGIETGSLKYLKLKTLAFRHDVTDAIVTEQLPNGNFTKINRDEIRRQGLEVELETMPVHNLSLNSGYIFQDVRNFTTAETIKNIPRSAWDIGLKYDDNKSIRGLLTGHYIWWNAESSFDGRYSSVIWDLNLSKRIRKKTEVFLTAHNLFNGTQYLMGVFKNPERWLEAGARYKF